METYTGSGVAHWVAVPHDLAKWILKEHVVAVVIVLVPVTILISILLLLEQPLVVLTVGLFFALKAWRRVAATKAASAK